MAHLLKRNGIPYTLDTDVQAGFDMDNAGLGCNCKLAQAGM